MQTTKLTTLSTGILIALASAALAGSSHGSAHMNSQSPHPGPAMSKLDPAYLFTEILLPVETGFDFPGAWALNNNGTIVGNCNLDTDYNLSPGFKDERGVISILPAAPFSGGDSNPDDYQALGDPTGINDSNNTSLFLMPLLGRNPVAGRHGSITTVTLSAQPPVTGATYRTMDGC